MLFGKARPVISGGAAIIRGERYHLERVLYSYETLIDRLAARFTRGKSIVTSHREDLKGPLVWPDPAKAKVLPLWRGLAANYDALGEGIAHRFPLPMTAMAYVLGKSWTVYDRASGRHATPQWGDVDRLDTGPVIEIFGREIAQGRTGVEADTAEAIQRIVMTELAKLKLSVTLLCVEAVPGHAQVAMSVRFPREVYGAGEDWIRVRCVAPDGTELGDLGVSN